MNADLLMDAELQLSTLGRRNCLVLFLVALVPGKYSLPQLPVSAQELVRTRWRKD